jgi:hypothetical protein
VRAIGASRLAVERKVSPGLRRGVAEKRIEHETETLRRRSFSVPGRITCSARRFMVHLPVRPLTSHAFELL